MAEDSATTATIHPALRRGPVLPVTLDSQNPESVAATFLQSVKSGDAAALYGLLTEASRAALDESGLQPFAAGKPLAYFHVKSPLYLAAETKGVHVPCVWSESDHASAAEFIMVLRQESPGWRVAGLVQSTTEDNTVIFNFESAFDLAATSTSHK